MGGGVKGGVALSWLLIIFMRGERSLDL